jgi:hypothetical protein
MDFCNDLFILAKKHRLFIIADEVYQENVYLPGSKFFSFKKVLMELGSPFNQMEMGMMHVLNHFFDNLLFFFYSLISFSIERLAWRVSLINIDSFLK